MLRGRMFAFNAILPSFYDASFSEFFNSILKFCTGYLLAIIFALPSKPKIKSDRRRRIVCRSTSFSRISSFGPK